MKLKKLQENAHIQKLNEQDFRNKMTNMILDHQQSLSDMKNIITDLSESVEILKKQLDVVNNRSNFIQSKIKTNNQGLDNGNPTKQKRNS